MVRAGTVEPSFPKNLKTDGAYCKPPQGPVGPSMPITDGNSPLSATALRTKAMPAKVSVPDVEPWANRAATGARHGS